MVVANRPQMAAISKQQAQPVRAPTGPRAAASGLAMDASWTKKRQAVALEENQSSKRTSSSWSNQSEKRKEGESCFSAEQWETLPTHPDQDISLEEGRDAQHHFTALSLSFTFAPILICSLSLGLFLSDFSRSRWYAGEKMRFDHHQWCN